MQSLQKGKKIKSAAGKNKKPESGTGASITKDSGLATITLILLLLGSFFIYDGSIRDPYVSPRFIFIAAFLIVGIYWFMIYKKWGIQMSQPLTRGFIGVSLVFLTWNIVCATQAINLSESIFFICREILFFLSFILMLVLLNRQTDQLIIPKTLTVILIILSYIGVFQYYNFAFTFIPGDPHPTGISGNRNLYSSFLVLLLPFSFYTLMFAKPIWKFISAIAASVGMFAIILGQTRSAWLAFILATLFFQAGFFIMRKKLPQKMVRNWLWGSLIAVGMLAVALVIVIQTDKDGAMQARLKSRLQSLYSFNDLDDTVEASRNINERLLVWGGTVKMIQDAPLLGYGPGNWRLVFPQYGGMSAIEDGSLLQIDKVRVQPHNVYLHIASETGIPGLLLFLALGVLTLLAAFRNMRQAQNPPTILLNLLMAAGVIALAVDMAFSFPNERMEHGILVALIAAFVFSSLEKSAKDPSKVFYLPGSAYFFTALPILIFCIALGNAKWKFDYYLMQVIQYELKRDYPKVLEAANKGKNKLVTLDPVSDPMEFHTARAYAAMRQYGKALEEITMAEHFHPNSHRIYNTKAVIYISENRFQEALEPLEKAIHLSPHYTPSLSNLAYSYYRTNQFDSSLQILERMDISQDTMLQKLKLDVEKRINGGIINEK